LSCNTKTRPLVSLRFTLSQHSRDEVLMKSLYNCLGCEGYNPVYGRDEGYFTVSSLSDIYGKIIPLLEKYPLVGSKQQDYLDFRKAVELMKSKAHLTEEGLDEIKQIKGAINRGRNSHMGLYKIVGQLSINKFYIDCCNYKYCVSNFTICWKLIRPYILEYLIHSVTILRILTISRKTNLGFLCSLFR